MKSTNREIRSSDVLGVFMLTLSVTGCLAVPHPVSPDVTLNENPVLTNDIILSLGPRELLEDFTNHISGTYENIEVVDGMLFRETAFPDGGWKLSQLLEPDTCSRVSIQLDIDYLVIVGQEELSFGEEKGGYFPLLYGAMWQEKVSKISSVILDMKTRETVRQISSEAHATEMAVIYVVIVAGNVPLTSSSAIKGLAKDTGRVIDELVKSEKVRIAVIAAESTLHEHKEQE